MNTTKYASNFTAMVSSQNMLDIQVILQEKAANALVSSAADKLKQFFSTLLTGR
jgi:hypothetical protein